MNKLESRWIDDPVYQFILQYLRDPALRPTDQTWQEWHATAPAAPHPTLNESLDCRQLRLDHQEFGKSEFSFVLDGSALTACTFTRSLFQHASAAHCDFTGSRFIVAQMSPIYAPGAIFKDCVFDTCFVMGIGPRYAMKGAFSDLRGGDFSGVKADKTGFDKCDFRGATLRQAHFVNCLFPKADLRGVDLTGTRFEGCDFYAAQLDDTPEVRALVQVGNNLELGEIHWVKPG